eukprot:gene20104-14668_t
MENRNLKPPVRPDSPKPVPPDLGGLHFCRLPASQTIPRGTEGQTKGEGCQFDGEVNESLREKETG